MAALTGTNVLFSDSFSQAGSLNSQNWQINAAFWGDGGKLNPAFLGNTFIRQELPEAAGGMARIKLDTWNPVFKDGNSHYGSEAITKGAWDAQSTGGVAFQAKMKFEGTQGGMIAGLFFYEQFTSTPDVQPRVPHNELDWEILTSQLQPSSVNKISTNVFPHQASGNGEKDYPHSYPVTQIPGFSPNDWHTYRVEWLPNRVTWLIDGKVIRTETEHLPQAAVKQQLHINLWGVPDFWGPSPGDAPPISPQTGPNLGTNTFEPAKSAAGNRTFFFDVDDVKVEKLSTRLGSTANDSLTGTANNDGIDGGNGADTLRGQSGDDTIWGGAGNDRIVGGNGMDTMHGDADNDELLGQADDDTIWGGAGDDRVFGGDGNDTMYGEADNDVLLGQSGDDTISGGAGDDRIFGGDGKDTMYGEDGNDVLEGQADDDTISGGAGDDQIVGGDGDDTMDGGSGDDRLIGQAGNDRLTGGLGQDRFAGGAGSDHFVYTSIADSLVAAPDIINGWETGDKIDLSAIDANTRVFGFQDFEFIGAAAFTEAGQLQSIKQSGNTIVLGDINGDGVAEFQITLLGNHNLTDGSFIL